ncbi:Uncharacterized protein TCM_034206 [Theobroma cacao]|uniref:Uncharacterized protein n=1 Tax=Theobroma cacao TaxID=3641 RepID=A0A061FDK9_THECC|nr:Uncharacterized protein TCM_034206 [Theobroma cacao]
MVRPSSWNVGTHLVKVRLGFVLHVRAEVGRLSTFQTTVLDDSKSGLLRTLIGSLDSDNAARHRLVFSLS